MGLGSPAQEVGQYLISHMAPGARRACERELVRTYHDALCAELRARGKEAEAEAYTFEACWAEYVAGGAGLWLWMVPVLVQMIRDERSGQFFHDQLAAFLHDHVPDPAKVGMPRV